LMKGKSRVVLKVDSLVKTTAEMWDT
jgi:hypothetical protein